jgi:hypothetical protein
VAVIHNQDSAAAFQQQAGDQRTCQTLANNQMIDPQGHSSIV